MERKAIMPQIAAQAANAPKIIRIAPGAKMLVSVEVAPSNAIVPTAANKPVMKEISAGIFNSLCHLLPFLGAGPAVSVLLFGSETKVFVAVVVIFCVVWGTNVAATFKLKTNKIAKNVKINCFIIFKS